MHARAVQALAVVLADDLPVGAHLVGTPRRPAQVAHAVALQPRHQVADVLARRPGPARGVEQDEPADHLAAHAVQGARSAIEVDEAVGVRRAREAAVEAVAPGVVGALQAAHAALGSVDDAGPAVPAGVVEGVRHSGVVADDEDALAADLARQETPALADLLDVARGDPSAEEQLVELPLKDPLVHVGRTREHRRLLRRPTRPRHLVDPQGGQPAIGHLTDLQCSGGVTLAHGLCDWQLVQCAHDAVTNGVAAELRTHVGWPAEGPGPRRSCTLRGRARPPTPATYAAPWR